MKNSSLSCHLLIGYHIKLFLERIQFNSADAGVLNALFKKALFRCPINALFKKAFLNRITYDPPKKKIESPKMKAKSIPNKFSF